MIVQVKETLVKLMDPLEKKRFGAWKLIIPNNNNNKWILSNTLNLWFILIRIFSKFKTLISLVKIISFKPKKKDIKKKSEALNKQINLNSKNKKYCKQTSIFSSNKKSLHIVDENKKKLNWKSFSENFKFPSIFIKDWNFLFEVIKPILFDHKICNYMVTFAKKFLKEKKKDKVLERTIKSCLRLFLVFKRNYDRDTQILEFLYELVTINHNLITKGNSFL